MDWSKWLPFAIFAVVAVAVAVPLIVARRLRGTDSDPGRDVVLSKPLPLPPDETWLLVKQAVEANFRLFGPTDEGLHVIGFRTMYSTYGEKLTARVEPSESGSLVSVIVAPIMDASLPWGQQSVSSRDAASFFEAVDLVYKHRNDPPAKQAPDENDDPFPDGPY